MGSLPELFENPIEEPSTIPPPSSSISHTSTFSTTHHTPSSVPYNANSHTHSHTTEHLHHTNPTTPTATSITTLTPMISPKQLCQKKIKNHTCTSLHHNVQQHICAYHFSQETSFQTNKTTRTDYHSKEKPTYTQSLHFH